MDHLVTEEVGTEYLVLIGLSVTKDGGTKATQQTKESKPASRAGGFGLNAMARKKQSRCR